jgi:hypothetical protein
VTHPNPPPARLGRQPNVFRAMGQCLPVGASWGTPSAAGAGLKAANDEFVQCQS